MRVITGLYRGLRLHTPPDLNIRPTSDKIKEAIFSSIQFLLSGACFLDLFSGSGQIGIEALSRGVKNCIFVDKNTTLLKKNLSLLKHTAEQFNFKVLTQDVRSAILLMTGQNISFDIVFMDPPYNKNLIPAVLSELPPILKDGAIIICEHSVDDVVPDTTDCFDRIKQRKYGKIMLTIYKRRST